MGSALIATVGPVSSSNGSTIMSERLLDHCSSSPPAGVSNHLHNSDHSHAGLALDSGPAHGSDLALRSTGEGSGEEGSGEGSGDGSGDGSGEGSGDGSGEGVGEPPDDVVSERREGEASGDDCGRSPNIYKVLFVFVLKVR